MVHDKEIWEEIEPSNLPKQFPKESLRIFRHDESTFLNHAKVFPPLMRYDLFFPDTSPWKVLYALCDVRTRLRWDSPYTMFKQIEAKSDSCTEKKYEARANDRSEDHVQNLSPQPIESLPSNALFCHRVTLSRFVGLKFRARLSCYERLIRFIPNYKTRVPKEEIFVLQPSFVPLGRTKEKEVDDSRLIEEKKKNTRLAYRISFLHRKPQKKWNVQQPTDIVSHIAVQEYLIKWNTHGERNGTELSIKTSVDVGTPQWLPRGIQTLLLSHFSTTSFLRLYNFLSRG